MTTALIALLLSTGVAPHGQPIPADFDLADMASTRIAETDDPRRFLIGDVDTPVGETRPMVRVRGAKVKLRVPLG